MSLPLEYQLEMCNKLFKKHFKECGEEEGLRRIGLSHCCFCHGKGFLWEMIKPEFNEISVANKDTVCDTITEKKKIIPCKYCIKRFLERLRTNILLYPYFWNDTNYKNIVI